MVADRVIRRTTAAAVIGVAAVPAVASYAHAYALVGAHGEAGWTGRLVPLMADGPIYAISMVMPDSARRKVPVPALASWLAEGDACAGHQAQLYCRMLSGQKSLHLILVPAAYTNRRDVTCAICASHPLGGPAV
jgi:hypothetical protein